MKTVLLNLLIFGLGLVGLFLLVKLTPGDTPKTIDELHAINDTTREQKVVIDAISGKTRYCMNRILEMDQYAAELFYETAHCIMKIIKEGQGKKGVT